MANIIELERDVARAKAGLSEAEAADLQRKLETVKATLTDDVAAEVKVRWLRGFLGV